MFLSFHYLAKFAVDINHGRMANVSRQIVFRNDIDVAEERYRKYSKGALYTWAAPLKDSHRGLIFTWLRKFVMLSLLSYCAVW